MKQSKMPFKGKKAFVDMVLLGFFLIATVTTFVATVSDELKARNKYYKIEKLIYNAAKTLSKHYMYNEDMEDAQLVANGILNSTTLGQELINDNLISYVWKDSDDDGYPNTVTVEVYGYIEDTFWYRLLGQTYFNVPSTDVTTYVTKDQSDITSISMKYGGSDAGYDNMIGTYEIDSDGNCINTKLIIANRDNYSVGDYIGSYTNLATKFFIVPDGYNQFGNRTSTLESSVLISGCSEGGIPSVTIDGNTNSTSVYFQDALFNNDGGYDHMQEVGKTYFDDYLEYTAGEEVCVRWRRGRCREYEHQTRTWEEWVVHAAENAIDFTNDPNDEYIIAMEDLPNGGDADFNDIKLDTTKVRTPRLIDTSLVVDYTDVSPEV